jgi:catechol 2,3-dioxygenase-like lactoylglutathione lyase family enzyme
MKIRRIDHVSVIVKDIAAARDFFLEMGLQVQGETKMEGEWLGRIVGLNDVKTEVVMMQTADGEANLELAKFIKPTDANGVQPGFSNTLGIRHICFAVEGLDALVAKLQKKFGAELVGEIHNYQDVYRLCYLRGPEGIILELAEEIGGE